MPKDLMWEPQATDSRAPTFADESAAPGESLDPLELQPAAPSVDPSSGDAGVRSRFPAVAGSVAALWSLLIGMSLLALFVLALWVLAPNGQGGAVAAWRGVGLVWLAGHQVPMLVAGRELTLLPLGAVVPALLILRRAGLWAARIVARPRPGEGIAMVLAGGLLYGAAGAGVAWLTTSPATGAQPAWAGGCVAVVGMLGLAWGVGGEAGWVPALRNWLGDAAWRVWLGGLGAFLGLFALGSALVTGTLIAQFRDVATTLASLHAGIVGSLGVTLLGILALPTMAIWAMAIAVGASVSFGGSGSLGVHGGELGQLPALPVLAGLPAQIPSWVAWLMVVPVILGVLAGRIRWGRDLPTVAGVLASAVGLVAVVAVLVSGAVVLASGSLGGQRLADIGPDLLAAAGSAAGLVALGFLLEAGWQAVALSWHLHRTESQTIDLTGTSAGPPQSQAPVG